MTANTLVGKNTDFTIWFFSYIGQKSDAYSKVIQRSKNSDLSINKFYWHCQGHILCLSTHLFVKNLVCEAALCLIQDQSIFSEEKWTIKYVNMSLLQHCLSQQLRRNSTSYKKQSEKYFTVKQQPLQIYITLNSCKM